MSPRTEKQYEEIREERKTQIKRVALEIISEEGFQDTSISKIAKRAGISKGLMYNYYKSKEEMIREIIIEGIEELSVIFDPNKDGILTEEEARYFIDELFNMLKSNLHYWQLYFTVMLQPKVMALVLDKFMETLTPFIQIVRNYFTHRGSENPEVDTRIMLALIDGICFHYILDPKNFPIDEIKERLYKMI